MNRAEEDYIKLIYEFQEKLNDDKYVSNNELVETLGHSPQTINEMVKKLAKKGYLDYIRYKGSRLTDSGFEIAINLVRKHRLWERFLVDKLGFSWDEIHEEAELLEHVTSEKLERKLFNYLDEPMYCPHGNPIPRIDGSIETLNNVPLYNTLEGRSYQITSIIDNKEVLIYFDSIHLKLNDVVTIKKIDKLNEIIVISNNQGDITIGKKISKLIYVKEN